MSANSFLIAALKSLNFDQRYIGKNVKSGCNNTSTTGSQEKFGTIKTKLTARQRQVLECIVKGYANKLIAYELGVSEGTVKLHVSSILKTLKVTNRTAAAIRAGQLVDHQMH